MSKPLDVLLVTPPSRVQVYQELSRDFAAIEPPVWSGLIATYLRQHSCSVAILDAEAQGLNHEQTAQQIAADLSQIRGLCDLWPTALGLHPMYAGRPEGLRDLCIPSATFPPWLWVRIPRRCHSVPCSKSPIPMFVRAKVRLPFSGC